MIVASQLDYERRPVGVVLVLTDAEAGAVLEALDVAHSVWGKDAGMDPAARVITEELERRLAALADMAVAGPPPPAPKNQGKLLD